MGHIYSSGIIEIIMDYESSFTLYLGVKVKYSLVHVPRITAWNANEACAKSL